MVIEYKTLKKIQNFFHNAAAQEQENESPSIYGVSLLVFQLCQYLSTYLPYHIILVSSGKKCRIEHKTGTSLLCSLASLVIKNLRKMFTKYSLLSFRLLSLNSSSRASEASSSQTVSFSACNCSSLRDT